MGKVVEKKKKGRPSLLDLQKRKLKELELQQKQQKGNPNQNPNISSNSYPKSSISPNPNSNPNPIRRSTRRNPNPDEIESNLDGKEVGEDDDDDDDDADDDGDEDLSGKPREKDLKLFQPQNDRSVLNSASLLSNSSGYGLKAEDENNENPLKKQKINAVGDRSVQIRGEKILQEEKQTSTLEMKDTFSGKLLESGPTTPLPDQALLVFILDRLQKKDTYGVYSEPVDPEELPDYHDIVEHPMDFGTVRKKLSSGEYINLEQFEKDVYLICSNAMQYNEPHTIYFRQARSIQELAKKNFENLRQDGNDNTPEPKIARRGRPPTKNLKRLGRPPSKIAGSEFSDASMVPGGDSNALANSYGLRKLPLSDKSSLDGASGRTLYGSRNNELHNVVPEPRSEWNDEFPGSMLKGTSMKSGKKQLIFDENRRNTYTKSSPYGGGREVSVFSSFDGEKRQLMAVGLHTEHGYTRSLARFAANLGPIVWKIASKKIERALPAGVKYGPGWVGQTEASLTQFPARHFPPQATISESRTSSPSTHAIDSTIGNSSVNQESPNVLPNGTVTSSTIASSPVTTNRYPDPLSKSADFGGSVSASRPNPHIQNHQSPGFTHPINGFNGGFGFNLPSQMGKLVRPTHMTTRFNSETSSHSPAIDAVSSISNNNLQSIPANHSESQDRILPGTSSTVNLSNSTGLAQQKLSSLQSKADSVPPDLNSRFQSPGSSNSTQQQPDLALQL